MMASGKILMDSARHRRILIILNVGCSKYVRALIEKHLNDSKPSLDETTIWNLNEFLKQNKHKIDPVRNSKLNYREKSLLYPSFGTTNLEHWDLTLLTMIYLNHCGPSSAEKMDINILRDRRNTLCHSATYVLSESEYDTYLNEIDVISGRCLKIVDNEELTAEVIECLNNNHEFGLDRLRGLTCELQAKLKKDDQEYTNQKQLLSEILDILKQLYPEATAMSIPDIKLKLDVKNCIKEKERFICEKVIECVEAESADISDDIKQVFHRAMMKVLQKDVEIVSAEHKCIIITLRCHSVRGLSNLWLEYTKYSVDIFEPLQAYLRKLEGYENVQVETEILKSDIWECVHTIVGNMFNDLEDATKPDIAECNAFESTVSESRTSKIPYTISHDGNDTFVKIDAKVDSFQHMKQILDVCESGTMKNSLENIATALKDNLSLEDLSIQISVDANATLKQIKERYLSLIVTPEEPNEDIGGDSVVQNIGLGDDISDEGESGRCNRVLYQETLERLHLFGYFGSYASLPAASSTPAESVKDSGYDTSDVQSMCSSSSILNKKDASLPTPEESVKDSGYDTSYVQSMCSSRSILNKKDASLPAACSTPAESVKDSGYDTSDVQSMCSSSSILNKKESRKDEAIRYMSVRLYDALDKVGASADSRKLRQDCAISRDIILTLSSQICQRLRSWYIFGSSSEGSTTHGMNSDTDILVCNDDYPIIDNISDAGDRHSLLMIRGDHTQPGYVKLQRVYNGQPQTIYMRDINHDEDVSDREGRICMKHVSSLGDERNGPADTLTEVNVDLVTGFRCLQIPKFCREWIGRERQYKWPSKRMIDKMSNMGCFVVGVGHPTSIERNLEWRVSFSLQEREMMFSMNIVQHKCYVVLKMIKKDLIEPEVGKSINSYHLKTCMFHTIENTNPIIWKRCNLFQCVLLCLSVLLKWVTKGYCPNYFIKEENMFERDIHRSQRLNLIRQINVLLSSGFEFLFTIKLDQIGVLLKYKNKCDVKIKSELDETLLIQKLCVLNSVVAFSSTLCDTVNQKPSSTLFISMILTYVSQTKSIMDHTEKQTQKAITYITPFVHLHLAQSFASLAFNTHNVETKYALLKESGYHLRKGHQCDLTSSALLEAIVFYKLEQYERCIAVLDQLESKLNRKPISICRCDRKATYYTDEHVRQISALSVPSIISRVATCVRFLRSYMSIIPEALHYEMYRSINTPPGSRNVIDDQWFDQTVVDAVVFLHFMQYLVHAKLNQLIPKHLAINKLESVLHGDQTLGHRETGYNLLGWIHFHEGWISQGMKYFRKSWSIRPYHNAAKFHIMMFLFG